MENTTYSGVADRIRQHAAQLVDLRQRLRDAQARARDFGLRLPRGKYQALLDEIRKHEGALAEAQAAAYEGRESEAIQFMEAARKLLAPDTFEQIRMSPLWGVAAEL